MNTNMYTNPIVQKNMEYLKELGYEFIDPGTGMLACQTYGPGRMAEPKEIVDYILDNFTNKKTIWQKNSSNCWPYYGANRSSKVYN